jgi:hypothetical protein
VSRIEPVHTFSQGLSGHQPEHPSMNKLPKQLVVPALVFDYVPYFLKNILFINNQQKF